MKHCIKPKIFIFDFNIVPEILSGYSLLSQLKYHDFDKLDIVVILNRECDLTIELEKLKVKYKIITYGRQTIIEKISDYGTLPFKLLYLYYKYRPIMVHANNAMAGRAAMIFKYLFNIPVLVQIRNNTLPPRTLSLISRADYFATVSKATMVEALPKELHKKNKIVYDGIDMQEYGFPHLEQDNVSNFFDIPINSIVIGMCSRLSEQKGIDDFLYAAKIITEKYNDVYFVHAGGIPKKGSKDNFIEQLASSSIGNFIWYGYTNNMIKFWENVDIAVVPSSGPEAFGRVVIEAMAASTPVIATRSGGPDEIIDDNVNGILISMKDRQSLVQNIDRLINNSKERERLGQGGYKKVKMYFSAQSYSNKMQEYYQEIID